MRKAFDNAIPVRPYESARFEEFEAIMLDAVFPEVIEHLWHPNPLLHFLLEPCMSTSTAVCVVNPVRNLVGAVVAYTVTDTVSVNTAISGLVDLDTVKLMAHIGHCLAVVDVAKNNQEAAALVLRSKELDLWSLSAIVATRDVVSRISPALPAHVAHLRNCRKRSGSTMGFCRVVERHWRHVRDRDPRLACPTPQHGDLVGDKARYNPYLASRARRNICEFCLFSPVWKGSLRRDSETLVDVALGRLGVRHEPRRLCSAIQRRLSC